uniref:Uncharacterized protein n=1 Tax=Tanacetum cinerariifolium TaxID=118510 RepID=A0A699L1T9_TANCI|nr:hypothetical protein [Tanacetum cinerariifolium]
MSNSPKKSICKGLQGKKIADTHVEEVEVSEESEPKPTKKKTLSKRRVKKKVTISIDNNIIPDPDVTLELGKSISLTKAEQEEAARQVHATHEKIVTGSVLKPTRRRSSKITISDTAQVSKKASFDESQKLKGIQTLTTEEKEAVDVIQALKESKKTSRRQPRTRGSSEGTRRPTGVPNKSTVISTTSSKRTCAKPGVLDEEKVTKENVILEWESKEESKYMEEVQADDEEIDSIDSDEDDEKKDDAEDDKSIDIEKTDDEETDDELLQGKEQVNDDEDEEMKEFEVAKFEKEHDVFELKKIDHSAETLATLKSHVPAIVENYLGTKVRDVFQKELQKHTADLIQKYYLQHILELTKRKTPTVDLEKES